MGWKGERQRHSMSARGIKTKSDIDQQMRQLQEQQAILNQQQEKLLNERKMFDNIEFVERLFYEEIEELPYKKMENIPLTQKEIDDIFNNMDIEDYVDVEYDGDYDYFLEDWPIFMEKIQEDYQLYDVNDYKRAEEFMLEYGDFDDDDDEMPDITRSDVEEYIGSLTMREFKNYYMNYSQGRWSPNAREVISDFGGAMDVVRQYGELTIDGATKYSEEHGTRDPLEERFKVTKQDKEQLWNKILTKHNLTQEQYDHIKSLAGDA